MRIAVGGLLIAGIALATYVLADMPNPGQSLRTTAATFGSSGGLIGLSHSLADHSQQVTVIDSATRSLAVYQIDMKGQPVLRSVRKIDYDLQMEEFNGRDPLPSAIRAHLETDKSYNAPPRR